MPVKYLIIRNVGPVIFSHRFVLIVIISKSALGLRSVFVVFAFSVFQRAEYSDENICRLQLQLKSPVLQLYTRLNTKKKLTICQSSSD